MLFRSIIELDVLNPQVAARVARSFDRWKRFGASRQAHARAALERIQSTSGLSRDVGEIVGRALAWTAPAWLVLIACELDLPPWQSICAWLVATALAIGTVVLPIMLSRGYERRFSIGVISSSGTLGILIPPSTAMIVLLLSRITRRPWRSGTET